MFVGKCTLSNTLNNIRVSRHKTYNLKRLENITDALLSTVICIYKVDSRYVERRRDISVSVIDPKSRKRFRFEPTV